MGYERFIGSCVNGHLADLKILAAILVSQIEEEPHVYTPRKERGRRSVVSKGWRDRLQNYEWKPRNGSDGIGQARQIAADFEPVAQKIDAGLPLTDEDHELLKSLARRTFEWGGVERGATKQNPTGDQIAAVIASALQWRHVNDAFMDSGWTKVAAFGTAWLEDADRTPQIIYDSRVAAGLIRNVEKAILTGGEGWSDKFKAYVQDQLRWVPGRDANRLRSLQLRWRSGYQKWQPQFFGSLLVRLMRDALNAQPERYGLMPDQDGDRRWTMRGIEMVMFMEGY
ncbi:hypothetical protein [Microvirga soli]|uniref:hypothetical protein n=1 Tax=Microvirga soli TaxID=1854496 RepID=UPI00191F654A|nr:hypothetical protein [Microvirga soli]